MKYAFVTNVGMICYRVLPLFQDEKDVTIISPDPIHTFFKEFTSFKTIELNANPNLITANYPNNILNLFWNWREYKKFFKNIKDSEIYFFGNSWRLGVFKHIKKLAKNNKLFYYPSDQSPTNFRYRKDYLSNFICYLVKLITGLKVRIVSDCGVASFELHPDFFTENNVETLSLQLPPTHKFDVELPIMKDKTVLITTEDLEQYVTNPKIVDTAIRIIGRDNLIIKQHPDQKSTTLTMLNSDLVPSCIPSELLMSHNWKYVVGVESLALIKATQLTKATVISLLNLFDYKDPKRKQDLIYWQMKESNMKIRFPKTLEEFKEMIL